ncbi:hypothetical protein TcWFU_003280 [Taenia crassiceps]|uniref:Uncharacterized protein n=1 Tax=Taenia crassiceps TaxID=6207 RepID=A0ABR4QG57_9CEST
MFNENTGKWTNDAANQRQKWELMSGAICLHNIPTEIEGSSDDMSWLSLADEREERGINSVKALFWSPLIPHVVGMRCITMKYRIDADFEISEKCSLSILRQQDGELLVRFFVLNLSSDSLPKPYYVWTLNENTDPLPKPYFVWTFEEDAGSWVNDAANWNQKWELMSGAICLHNVPLEPKKHSKNIPWLSLTSKKEEEAAKAKAPLWSPPVPQAVGMRCITMDYKINVASGDFQIYNLALLQQQDGILHTWTFDEDLADWTNDLTNWHHKWRVERHQLCLTAKSGSDAKNPSPWSSSTRKKLSNPSADVQARLWSIPIPSDVGIRCLSLSYFISGNVMGESINAKKSVQLSLLHHHDM